MIYRFSQMLVALAVIVGCSTGLTSIEHASEDYKQNRGYSSLETVAYSFYKGMRRSEVERLLGDPDYSPIDGQYYYSSSGSVDSDEQGRGVTAGLVVDYRDEHGEVTDTLYEYRLGPIGE
jgi:outer membrane protein assembly factor BamE (lipoprotein component of BamABCDE complex)